jgi:hypothetical protein
MNHYLISANVSWVVAVGLVLFVLALRNQSQISVRFCIYTMSIGAWSFGWARMVMSTNPEAGLFWARALHLGAIFIPTTFCHFAFSLFPEQFTFQKKRMIALGYVSSCLFSLACFSSQFVPSTAPHSGMTYYPQPGFLYVPFLLYFLIYVCLALVSLGKEFRKATGIKRTQMQYVFVAYFIGYAGGAQAFLPVFRIHMPSYAMYSVPVGNGILAYSILAHRLMDINVIIRKTIVYSVVMGTLIAVYVATITLSAHLFEGLAGRETLFSSALAAGLITFFSQPLRKRVQHFVDSKFFRQYVDREEKLYELSREVITHTTPEAMGNALIHVLEQTLHPKTGALYLKSSGGVGFNRISIVNPETLPVVIADENDLTLYFKTHPQPFIREMEDENGESRSTRIEEKREGAA